MAKKRAVKKKGRKAPARKGGHKKQAGKPVGRKASAGSGRRARKKTVRARKAAPQSAAAAPVASPDFGRPEGESQNDAA